MVAGPPLVKLKTSKGSPPTLGSAPGKNRVTGRVGQHDVQVARRARRPADREEGLVPLED